MDEKIVQLISAVVALGVLGGGLTLLLLIANRFLANYGPCKISINNNEKEFTIDGGCSLLDALYEEKIFIPSACGGQGTCGFCKVNVLDGGGPLLPTEAPYMSKAEIANQTRLACQVKVKQDMVLKVREDFLNVKEFQATVTKAEMKTDDTREIHFKLIEPSEMNFKPGQYIQVRVPGGGEFRAYSICSPVSSKNEIELLVRLIPGGVGSTYIHSLEVGDEVTMTGPYGEFILDNEKPLICVGGGCGMAPMRSLIRSIQETNPTQECWLFFGARTPEQSMYHEEFMALTKEMPNLHVHYAMSEPDNCPDWHGETGFIHESVAHHIEGDADRQAFLCGPPIMIEATMDVLQQKGMSREAVFFDEF